MTDLHLFNGDESYAYVAPAKAERAWRIPACRRGGLFYDDARAITIGVEPPTSSYAVVDVTGPDVGILVAVYEADNDIVRALFDLDGFFASGAALTYLGNEGHK